MTDDFVKIQNQYTDAIANLEQYDRLFKDLAKGLGCEPHRRTMFDAIANLKANQQSQLPENELLEARSESTFLREMHGCFLFALSEELGCERDGDSALVAIADLKKRTPTDDKDLGSFYRQLAQTLECEAGSIPIFSKIHDLQNEVARLVLKISGLDFNSCIAELAEFLGCEQTKEAVFRDIYTFKNKLNESKSAIRRYELDFEQMTTMLRVDFDETNILGAIADLQKTLARSQEELRNNLTHFPSINFTHNRWEYDYANVGAMIAEHKRMADAIADLKAAMPSENSVTIPRGKLTHVFERIAEELNCKADDESICQAIADLKNLLWQSKYESQIYDHVIDRVATELGCGRYEGDLLGAIADLKKRAGANSIGAGTIASECEERYLRCAADLERVAGYIGDYKKRWWDCIEALDCTDGDLLGAIADLKNSLARSQEDVRLNTNATEYIGSRRIEFSHRGIGYQYLNVLHLVADYKCMVDAIANHGLQDLDAQEKVCEDSPKTLTDMLFSKEKNDRGFRDIARDLDKAREARDALNRSSDFEKGRSVSLNNFSPNRLKAISENPVEDVRQERDRAIEKANALEMNYDFAQQHRQDLLNKLAIAEKTIKILLDKIPD